MKALLSNVKMLDEEQQARRRYKKDLAHIKPDLVAYNKQKAMAMGATPGASSSSSALTSFNPQGSAVRSLVPIGITSVLTISIGCNVRTATSGRVSLS